MLRFCVAPTGGKKEIRPTMEVMGTVAVAIADVVDADARE